MNQLRKENQPLYQNSQITSPPTPSSTFRSISSATKQQQYQFAQHQQGNRMEEELHGFMASPDCCAASEVYDDLGEKIVDAIVEYPCLWNTHLRCYKDINKKEQAWKELQQYLQTPMETIKRKWAKLRQNYRKCLQRRELKTRSGAGLSKLPTCKSFEQLHFLKDILMDKPSYGNIEITRPIIPIQDPLADFHDNFYSKKTIETKT